MNPLPTDEEHKAFEAYLKKAKIDTTNIELENHVFEAFVAGRRSVKRVK